MSRRLVLLAVLSILVAGSARPAHATFSSSANGHILLSSGSRHQLSLLSLDPLGQTLFVTEGVGQVQRRGGPVEIIRPGDRVYIEPDEEHWHGATPTRLMVHLALNEVDAEHVAVHWGDKVADDEYSTAPTSER